MTRAAAAAAQVLLALIGMLLLAVLSLFVVAVYLTTYPVLRLSQHDARLRTGMEAAAAVAAFLGTLRSAGEPEQPGGPRIYVPHPPPERTWAGHKLDRP